MSEQPTPVSKWKTALSPLSGLLMCWLALLLVLRVGEFIYNGIAHHFPVQWLQWWGLALVYDLYFFTITGVLLLLISWPMALFSLKAARGVFIITAILIMLGYFSLLGYFSVTMVPLGADLYSYSREEVMQTIGASGSLNLATVITTIVLLAVLYFAFTKLAPRWQLPAKWAGVLLVLMTAGLLAGVIAGPYHPRLDNEYDNTLVVNKAVFFLQASGSHFFPADNETDIYSDAYSGDFGLPPGSDVVQRFTYVDEREYPFLHLESTQDVLSPFFQKDSIRPNIVVLLVEGLGRAFTNEGAYLGNFTPYLDSLSQHSLYWPNFLSSGGRTFAVLPSVMGSLPFGKNGFDEAGDQMPDHLSLLSLLKANGYHTAFYYGGNATFDNMRLFLERQHIDAVEDEQTFPAGYPLMPANNGFTWGYGDRELFNYYLSRPPATPYLDILLTVSTHNPFLINDEATWQQAFENRMDQLGFTAAEKAAHRKYTNQYASILYADAALQQLIAAYSKRPDFAHTIFLITGDHRMPEIPMADKIDRYHVPLIIYSPLLQRTATFQSLSTHFDITPSLLAYLKNNYEVKAPDSVTWMGTGLDTVRDFRNIHAAPLMQTKTDLVDFIRGVYHLNGNQLFQLNEHLQETPVKDAALQQTLEAAFKRFREKNERLANGTPLLPDSLYRKYAPR